MFAWRTCAPNNAELFHFKQAYKRMSAGHKAERHGRQRARRKKLTWDFNFSGLAAHGCAAMPTGQQLFTPQIAGKPAIKYKYSGLIGCLEACENKVYSSNYKAKQAAQLHTSGCRGGCESTSRRTAAFRPHGNM
eukprot:scaffold258111_cov17-Tisochrysis_lutea.AAC.1